MQIKEVLQWFSENKTNYSINENRIREVYQIMFDNHLIALINQDKEIAIDCEQDKKVIFNAIIDFIKAIGFKEVKGGIMSNDGNLSIGYTLSL